VRCCTKRTERLLVQSKNGVAYDKMNNKWSAKLMTDGRRLRGTGRADNANDARKVRGVPSA
jgi:uncharacterized membrane protein